MSLALYEITERYKALNKLAESDDLPPEFILDTLNSIEGEFEVKSIAIAKFVLSLEASASAIADAAAAMDLRALRLKKRAASVRQYLLLQFQMVDFKKISTNELVIARRDNPVAVQVSDQTTIPDAYWRQPELPPKQIDKTSIKKALQAGVDVPGAYLESGERIEIKL